MVCLLFDAKPLPEQMLTYCQLDHQEQTLVKFESQYKTFHSRKCTWKCRLRNGGHIVRGDELIDGFYVDVIAYQSHEFNADEANLRYSCYRAFLRLSLMLI